MSAKNTDGRTVSETGSLAELQRIAGRIPAEQARVVREVAQKECEADIRANDALLTRGNTMLGASGVAVSFLVGLSKENAVNTSIERWSLGLTLVFAGVTVLFVVLSLKVRVANTVMTEATIFGKKVVGNDVGEGKPTVQAWQREHELVLALAYSEIRLNLARRHHLRATLMGIAHVAYVGFLIFVSGLALAIMC